MKKALLFLFLGMFVCAGISQAASISEIRNNIRMMRVQEARAAQEYYNTIHHKKKNEQESSAEQGTIPQGMQPPQMSGVNAKIKTGIWKNVARKFGDSIRQARAKLNIVAGIGQKRVQTPAEKLLFREQALRSRLKGELQICPVMSATFWGLPEGMFHHLGPGGISFGQALTLTKQFRLFQETRMYSPETLERYAQILQNKYGSISNAVESLQSQGIRVNVTTSYPLLLAQGGKNLFLLRKKDGVKVVAKLWQSIDPIVRFLPTGTSCIETSYDFVSLAMSNILHHQKTRASLCVLQCLGGKNIDFCKKCISGVAK